MSDLPSSQEQGPPPNRNAETEESRAQPAMAAYRSAGRLEGGVALIARGDSGLGRAIAVRFAKEGADVAFTYLDQHEDAQETIRLIEAEGHQALSIAGDLGHSDFAREVVRQTVAAFGRIDTLVNNAVEQHVVEKLEVLTDAQLERTFRTNIFSQLFLARSALPEMPDGSAIINTGSVAAFEGSREIVDYASGSGAVLSFTRSLARQLASRRIRVNAVLLRSALERVEGLVPVYVFFASKDAAYLSGQVLHTSGGEVANG